MASGMPFNFVNKAPVVTYEGVNILMYQQSVRMLLKKWAKVQQGKKVSGFFEYLNDYKSLLTVKSDAKTAKDFGTLEHILLAFKVRSAYQLNELHTLMASSDAS
jgi:hypothetical protein